MARMKRSEFKALVKECVRECLREVMQEQIVPMHEMMQRPRQAPDFSSLGLINPMDDHGMRLRQEVLNRGMMQGQLQRQSAQRGGLGLADLAGLNSQPVNENALAISSAIGSGGYSSPGDRLRFVDHSASVRYNPRLDTPMGGQMQAPTRHVPQYQQPRAPVGLDPRLDTPMGGGDMRAPSPELLKEIYDDTMRTTFVHQSMGELQGPVEDRFAAQVANSNPEDLFPGISKFAALAFK